MMAAALTLLRLGDTAATSTCTTRTRACRSPGGGRQLPVRRVLAHERWRRITSKGGGGRACRPRGARRRREHRLPGQADPLHRRDGRGHAPRAGARIDRAPAPRHRLVRVDQARAGRALPAPRRRRRADHRRLRPLRGRPPRRGRVLRRDRAGRAPQPHRLHGPGGDQDGGRGRARDERADAERRADQRHRPGAERGGGPRALLRAGVRRARGHRLRARPRRRRLHRPHAGAARRARRTRPARPASSSSPGTSATRPPSPPASTTAAATSSSRSTPTSRTRPS